MADVERAEEDNPGRPATVQLGRGVDPRRRKVTVIADRGIDSKLIEACMHNSTEEARRLIQEGGDPRYEDPKHWTPLMWASANGNETIVRLLLHRGAGEPYQIADMQADGLRPATAPAKPTRLTSSRPLFRFTPLHWAAFKGHTRIVWFLLKDRFSLVEQDLVGNTPMHQAAAGGQTETIQLLLCQGADITRRNKRGHPPLALCTVPQSCNLIKAAGRQTVCEKCTRTFSYTTLRYMCSYCQHFFCERCCSRYWTFDNLTADAKDRPITACCSCAEKITAAENLLTSSFEGRELEKIEETVSMIRREHLDVDVKLMDNAERAMKRLLAENELIEVLRMPAAASAEELTECLTQIAIKMDKASKQDAEQQILQRAKNLMRRLQAEKELYALRSREEQYTVEFISEWQMVLDKSRKLGAAFELIEETDLYIRKLELTKSLISLQQTAMPALEPESPNYPEWANENDKLKAFLNEFSTALKETIAAQAAQHVIDSAAAVHRNLMSVLEERVAKTEGTKKKQQKKKPAGKR